MCPFPSFEHLACEREGVGSDCIADGNARISFTSILEILASTRHEQKGVATKRKASNTNKAQRFNGYKQRKIRIKCLITCTYVLDKVQRDEKV